MFYIIHCLPNLINCQTSVRAKFVHICARICATSVRASVRASVRSHWLIDTAWAGGGHACVKHCLTFCRILENPIEPYRSLYDSTGS